MSQPYHRPDVKAPKLSGLALRAFIGAIDSPAGDVVVGKMLAANGVPEFLEKDPGHAGPIQVPLPFPPAPAEAPGTAAEQAMRATRLPRVARGERLETVASFNDAYRAGKADPVAVARRLNEAIDRIDGRDDRLGYFIARKPDEVLRAAEASAERWRKGASLGALDGVPVVVKDEVDLEGFPTTLGTSFLKEPAKVDSTVVARLKAAGAVILGKANMNEIGISPVGLNPHHGPARNPYHRGHITGGSSSASAATVGAGLCPVSIGADGGGSIRIPAALCGVVGLKATFSRISEAGVPPLCWNVGHVGPLGLTVADVAAAYALIAGPDPREPLTLAQPPVHLSGLGDGSLEGVRLGVCWPYFEDAQPDVVRRAREALKACTDAGATVVELPPPDHNTILWTHVVIITSEMAAAMRKHVREDVTRFALDSRLNLAMGRHFRGTDLVHAMRHRARLTQEQLELMKTCDAVVTPTTGTTAPPIPEETLPGGESNLALLEQLMRFVRLPNLTGFPSLAVPSGYDAKGLPTSVMFTGRPYEEHLLFRLGRVVEASVERRVPETHVTALT